MKMPLACLKAMAAPSPEGTSLQGNFVEHKNVQNAHRRNGNAAINALSINLDRPSCTDCE
jgi:hypothetical protein